MSLEIEIIDGNGTDRRAKVSKEGQLNVVVHPHPPKGETCLSIPFRQYFTTTGDSSGCSNMRVNGACCNVDFYISATCCQDIYIKTISIAIVDASATLSKFGNLCALTNGIEFEWRTQDTGIVVIADAIKTNFEFIRLAAGNPAFGDAATAFRASNVASTSEGYLPVIDLAKTFGLPYGIRLRKGTNDKLAFKIRDDVSGLDQFDAIAYGIRI